MQSLFCTVQLFDLICFVLRQDHLDTLQSRILDVVSASIAKGTAPAFVVNFTPAASTSLESCHLAFTLGMACRAFASVQSEAQGGLEELAFDSADGCLWDFMGYRIEQLTSALSDAVVAAGKEE
jgi:hypothetical protein